MLQRRNHCFHPRLTNYINANCLSLASVFVDLGFTHDRDDCELPDPWDAKSFGGKALHWQQLYDAVETLFGGNLAKSKATHTASVMEICGLVKLVGKSIIVSRPFN